MRCQHLDADSQMQDGCHAARACRQRRPTGPRSGGIRGDRLPRPGLQGTRPRYPAVNAVAAPSNGICRSLGFTLLGTVDDDWDGRIVTENHWVIDPAERLARA